jgi:hypothetical protein
LWYFGFQGDGVSAEEVQPSESVEGSTSPWCGRSS